MAMANDNYVVSVYCLRVETSFGVTQKNLPYFLEVYREKTKPTWPSNMLVFDTQTKFAANELVIQ